MSMRKRIGLMLVAALTMTTMLGNNVYARGMDTDDSIWTEINEYVSEQYSSLSFSEQQELANEIYLEKYATASVCSVSEENEDFVDVAYQNMLVRENYISN